MAVLLGTGAVIAEGDELERGFGFVESDTSSFEIRVIRPGFFSLPVFP
jgi:hypothetical protein